jgi:hypothetical protein
MTSRTAFINARLIDPAAALKTLHWGRNYLYVTRLDTVSGPLDVVVKQFRSRNLRDRLRRPTPRSLLQMGVQLIKEQTRSPLSTAGH